MIVNFIANQGSKGHAAGRSDSMIEDARPTISRLALFAATRRKLARACYARLAAR
jgi:hypothetical protein